MATFLIDSLHTAIALILIIYFTNAVLTPLNSSNNHKLEFTD
jgi:hypothetical protein